MSTNPRQIFAGLVAFLFITTTAGAQTTDITAPVDISLVPELISPSDTGLGGLPHYKYGIFASMGGSTNPQLYEFDTGGPGFYAVYSTNPAYASNAKAWGTNFTPVNSTNGTASYTSGNDYYGASVSTAVTIYSATNSTPDFATTITSATNVIVGQTTSITNADSSKAANTGWPTNGPAVESYFYGDFGLALASASNGIMNVIAQLNYASNVIPGFIVSLGTQPTNTNSAPNASNQIGLTTNDLANFPIKVYLNGQNTNILFSNTGVPTYSEAALLSSLTLSSTNGSGNFSMPVVIDSGATPAMHYTNTATNLTQFFNNGVSGGGVMSNTELTLNVTNTSNQTVDLYNVGIGDTSPDVGVTTTQTNVFGGGLYDFNIGEQLYYKYNVAYDLKDGIIAFQPISVPEPGTWCLFGVCGILLLGLLVLRRRSL